MDLAKLNPNGTALLGMLLTRACGFEDHITLTNWVSDPWQKPILKGERQTFTFVISAPDALSFARIWVGDLPCADIELPSGYIGDIRVNNGPIAQDDGTAKLEIMVLTVDD